MATLSAGILKKALESAALLTDTNTASNLNRVILHHYVKQDYLAVIAMSDHAFYYTKIPLLCDEEGITLPVKLEPAQESYFPDTGETRIPLQIVKELIKMLSKTRGVVELESCQGYRTGTQTLHMLLGDKKITYEIERNPYPDYKLILAWIPKIMESPHCSNRVKLNTRCMQLVYKAIGSEWVYSYGSVEPEKPLLLTTQDQVTCILFMPCKIWEG